DGQWKLHEELVLVPQSTGEEAGQSSDTAAVRDSLWRHLGDHPLQQLHVLVLVEDSRIDHPVVLVDGEAAGIEIEGRVFGAGGARAHGFSVALQLARNVPGPAVV